MSVPTAGVATSPSGVVYATDDLELGAAGFVFAESLEGRLIVPVPNTSARDALVATFGPSSTRPLIVYRHDAPAGARIEWTTNGTSWTPVGGADSGWVAPESVAGAWSGSQTTIRTRRVGQLVTARGYLGPADATAAAGSHNQVARLASGHRPPAGQTYRWAVSTHVNGASPNPYKASAEVAINASGDIYVYCNEQITGVTLNNVTFYVD